MNTKPTPTLAAVAPATTCCASWIPGDKPDTPKGSSTLMWVTLRHKESGKLSVSVLSYHNGHVMPCADHCDPPDCAVPHNPEEDGYCEEYEWTCWSDGYCEYCETEWVWHSHYSEIIAHAPVTTPEPCWAALWLCNKCGHEFAEIDAAVEEVSPYCDEMVIACPKCHANNLDEDGSLTHPDDRLPNARHLATGPEDAENKQ